MKEQKFHVNGVNLYALTNENLNGFCISVYIRAGSIYENKNNNGITHLFEHTVFRNIKKKFGDEFYELLDLNGITFSGSTYKEFLCFTVEAPRFGFQFACEVICSIFDSLNPDIREYNAEKERIKLEIRETDEARSVNHFFSKTIWKETNGEKSVSGTLSVIDRISLNKLESFRKDILSGDNCFFYVTGNVDSENLSLLKEKIGNIHFEQTSTERHNIIKQSDYFFNRQGFVKIKNSDYCSLHFGFDIDTQKYSGGIQDLIYKILFTGENSLLYQQLSENNPLIYSFNSKFEQYDNIGNIHFNFEISQDKITESIIRVVNVLCSLKQGRFNFEANLNSELANWVCNLDNPYELNWNLAYYNHILKTEPIDYSRDKLGRFSTVTKENITDASKDIFRKDNLTLIIEGKKSKIQLTEILNILNRLN